MKRRSAVCVLMTLASAAPATIGAQSRALSIGSASPRWEGSGAFSGFVVRGDLVWREPNHFLSWRASGSFTRVGGGMGASGDRLSPAQVYGLSASAVLSPPGYFVRSPKLAHVPYLAAGPGLYGYRSYTEYQLGWHLAAGLQVPVGQWTLFGEAMRTSLGSSDFSTGFNGSILRSLSIGIRR
jgi:hypothetical protein